MELETKLNATEAQLKLALLAGRFKNYEPVLKNGVSGVLRFVIRLHFATHGGYGEKPWAPLKPATLRRKRIDWLRVSDTMFKSLTQQRNPYQIHETTATTLTYGTRLWYAKFQHFGTKGRTRGARSTRGRFVASGGIPARPILPTRLSVGASARVREVIRRWIVFGEVGDPAGEQP